MLTLLFLLILGIESCLEERSKKTKQKVFATRVFYIVCKAIFGLRKSNRFPPIARIKSRIEFVVKKFAAVDIGEYGDEKRIKVQFNGAKDLYIEIIVIERVHWTSLKRISLVQGKDHATIDSVNEYGRHLLNESTEAYSLG